MLNKVGFVLSVILLICLFGCGKSENTEATTAESYINVSMGTAIKATQSDADSGIPNAVFSINQTIPIISNNELIGTMNVNWIDKIGIWDWYNEEAVYAGIKYCYAVNATIDMTYYLQETSEITLGITPKLIDDSNKSVGKVCNVGWSGFDQVEQFFIDDAVQTLEVCIQPIVSDTNEYQYFCLQLSDPQGMIDIDPIYLDVSLLKNAKETVKLHTVQEPVTITSINGAVLRIALGDVYYENHGNEDDSAYYYDFSYKVEYISGPTNNREVLSFDSFHKNQLINAPRIVLYADNCSTGLTEEDPAVIRYLDYEQTEEDDYVYALYSKIDVGYNSEASTNRLALKPELKSKYVRIVIEFPDEAQARTDDELHHFSGRYLVFQVPIAERKLVHTQ